MSKRCCKGSVALRIFEREMEKAVPLLTELDELPPAKRARTESAAPAPFPFESLFPELQGEVLSPERAGFVAPALLALTSKDNLLRFKGRRQRTSRLFFHMAREVRFLLFYFLIIISIFYFYYYHYFSVLGSRLSRRASSTCSSGRRSTSPLASTTTRPSF